MSKAVFMQLCFPFAKCDGLADELGTLGLDRRGGTGGASEEPARVPAGAPLTSLAGCAVLAVLSPVALDHLPLPGVFLHGEADAQDVVARLDDPQDPPDPLLLLFQALPGLQALHQLVLDDCGSAVEEAFHHSEEVRVVVPVHGLAVAATARQGGARRQKRVCSRGASAAAPAGKQLSEVSVHFVGDRASRGEFGAAEQLHGVREPQAECCGGGSSFLPALPVSARCCVSTRVLTVNH